MRASSTDLVRKPGQSRDEAYATRPERERRPYDGLKPTTPVYAAGRRTLPPVSLPSAANAAEVDTATAEPPLLPPADLKLRVRRSSSDAPAGTSSLAERIELTTGPLADVRLCDPIPNSSMAVLPMTMAPASRSRRTTVASYGASQPASAFDPAVVGSRSAVQKLALSATGTPSSFDRGASPRAKRLSTSRASSKALSRSVLSKAPRAFVCSMRSRTEVRRSSEVTSPAQSARADSAIRPASLSSFARSRVGPDP
mmetsp:Transcript_5153/g.17984  ORF Transcript_5153/g.17984 Transcript_5153/m.17984 type:complete len:255 (+) Transcript_5153:1175-1939(+)